MKNTALLLSLTALIAFPAWAADLSEDVKSASKKLAEKSNYSWTTKSESPQREGAQANAQGGAQGGGQARGRGFGGFSAGSTSGKTDKDGFTIITYTMGENTSEAVLKGEKVAVKSGDEWKTGDELTADNADAANNRNPGRSLAQRAQRTKLPAVDAQELVSKVSALKKDGDAYSGELTADAVKQMNTFGGGGRRPGGNAAATPPAGPDTSGLKGTAKFWVKDGVLSKYETHITGKMSFAGRQGGQAREIDVNRTTTVEIKDVGATKLEIPAEARKKLKS